MKGLKKRQKDILSAIHKCPNAVASIHQIAEITRLHPNGISQSLSALAGGGYVRCVHYVSGKGGESLWEIMPCRPW